MMCLAKVSKRLKPCKKGYKVFIETSAGLFFDCNGKSQPLPVNQWIHEGDWRHYGMGASEPIMLNASSGEKYPIGFHVYHRTWEAKTVGPRNGLDHVIRAVNVAEPVATGYQTGDVKCTIAKWIEILPGVV